MAELGEKMIKDFYKYGRKILIESMAKVRNLVNSVINQIMANSRNLGVKVKAKVKEKITESIKNDI